MKTNRLFYKHYFEEDKTKLNCSHFKSMDKKRKIFFPKAISNRKILKESKILDIGCAYGYFLKLCDEYGLETYGIDISEYVIKEASKNPIVKLYVQDVDIGFDLFEENYFDLITLFDVIEHVESPFRLLKSAYKVTKVGGKIFLTIPNLNSIERILWKEKWHGYQDKTHRYLFSILALSFLVHRLGFEIIEIETPFHSLPKFIQKLANKTDLGGQIWIVAKKEK